MFRNKALLVMLLIGTAFAGCSGDYEDGAAGVVSVSSEISVSGPTVSQLYRAQADLHGVLAREAVALGARAPLTVKVTGQELVDLALRDRRERKIFPGPRLVGMVKPVFAAVDLATVSLEAIAREPRLLDFGAVQGAGDGGFVWTTTVGSEGARALRVHISDMSLPAGTELFVYNLDGEAYGPYVERGPNDTGEFWTPSVGGFEMALQVRHYGVAVREDLVSTWFVIDQIGHIDPAAVELDAVEEANTGECCYHAACIENASCHNIGHLGGAESAVAHYNYIKRPYIYMCSGGLLADSSSGDTPYFLSANHCLSRQRDANSAEFFFDYATPCGITCGNSSNDGVKVTGGAEILSTDSAGDYTFMQIKEGVPAGRVFLGWTNAPIAFNHGAGLFRLSHPSGGPLAYSQHVVDTEKGTCGSWPRGGWIYSTDTLGATEGGSSGSVVLNAENQVVGQLSGSCGTNVYDDCDPVNNATVDGALAGYYDQLSGWLGTGEPQPTCSEDPTICAQGELCCNDQCVLPACSLDADCDDGDACTTDSCSLGGTCNAGCTSTWAACGLADGCCGPACTSGNDPDCQSCLPLGALCDADAECCSGKCRGKPGAMICR